MKQTQKATKIHGGGEQRKRTLTESGAPSSSSHLRSWCTCICEDSAGPAKCTGGLPSPLPVCHVVSRGLPAGEAFLSSWGPRFLGWVESGVPLICHTAISVLRHGLRGCGLFLFPKRPQKVGPLEKEGCLTEKAALRQGACLLPPKAPLIQTFRSSS